MSKIASDSDGVYSPNPDKFDCDDKACGRPSCLLCCLAVFTPAVACSSVQPQQMHREGGNVPSPLTTQQGAPRKHSHYFKACPYQRIDIYRVLSLFGVTDQALGHAVKKLLVAGGRGAGKDIHRDIQEAVDTLQRWQEMRDEDRAIEPGWNAGGSDA